MTFVVASAHLPACLAVFTQVGCGTACVLPLWPRSGTAAKLALVRGIKGGRGAFRLLPGLVLHESGDGYTAAADAILRDGAAIIL